jgi:predicted transcriptional regulator
MLRFLKKGSSAAPHAGPLGHLESDVMELLWTRGDSRVQEVVEALSRPLAYTTVMTTLDRLYKKGLLNRRKHDRAFVYAPRLSRIDWERRRAGELVSGFLAGPQPARHLLLSCFLEAVGEQDAPLLDELAHKIRVRHKELSKGGGS